MINLILVFLILGCTSLSEKQQNAKANFLSQKELFNQLRNEIQKSHSNYVIGPASINDTLIFDSLHIVSAFYPTKNQIAFQYSFNNSLDQTTFLYYVWGEPESKEGLIFDFGNQWFLYEADYDMYLD